MLMSSVSVSNCIKFYQTAEDIGAKDLQKYCAEIISNHWVGPIMQCNIHLCILLLFLHVSLTSVFLKCSLTDIASINQNPL